MTEEQLRFLPEIEVPEEINSEEVWEFLELPGSIDWDVLRAYLFLRECFMEYGASSALLDVLQSDLFWRALLAGPEGCDSLPSDFLNYAHGTLHGELFFMACQVLVVKVGKGINAVTLWKVVLKLGASSFTAEPSDYDTVSVNS